ncbi:MAG TPA: EAL domain-containing protein [Steroidobacteraceae bacterium]|nr:EAL domain-containing protein [Steroidobacteraceae bacterium]
MSTPQTALPAPQTEDSQPSSTTTTTLVRAELGLAMPAPEDLHPQVRAILKEATLRTGLEVPDFALLLKLVSLQFESMDAERRGIVQSMRLMADEAAELGYRARDSELIERVALAERAVFEQLTGSAPLADILASITRFIESVGVGTICSIAVLAPESQVFSYVVAPRLPFKLRTALEHCAVDIRNGSCAASVYLGRQVLVADIATDPFWEQRREQALEAGLRAAWSTPIKAGDGRVLGALGVYHSSSGLPGQRELRIIDHAAQIAGIAIARRLAEEALRASEAKYRGLFETIIEGVYQSSRDGRLRSVNPAFVRILGYDSAEELYALPSVATLYWNPADRAEFIRRVESEGEIRNAEFLVRRRDGEQVVILENARAVRDAANRITHYEGTIADITERKRAEQAMFAEKERAQVTLQSIGDAVISTDADGRIEYINPVAESLTAWTLEDARGRPIGEVLSLVNEITREPIENPLLCVLGGAETSSPADHSVLITRAGHEVAIQESAAPICDRAGRVIGAVIVFHDVTKERRLKRALSYQASHDALTGLINRREFDNRLHAAVLSAQRGEGTYALLYIDLDQFKVVNDTCGHQAGDRLLRDVTGLLQSRVRASDTIARLGGDEFGVLLEGCTVEQSTRIAEGVRQSIRDYRFVWGASTLSVGASVGVVQITHETESVANVMSAADIACYAAKDEGRNRVHLYESDGISHPRHREMHWVARVTRAAEENRLELFFQPIRPIGRTGATAFHELTVRLRDDDGRLVSPGEFIPAAERYNVMSVIDRWVVQRAIERLKEWAARGQLRAGEPSETRIHEAGPGAGKRARPPGMAGGPVPSVAAMEGQWHGAVARVLPEPRRLSEAAGLPLLAVNLSGTSLNEQSFIDFVLQQVGDATLAQALCFEITETAAVTNLSNATFVMRELKARGCRFALDDFGTGLSSFMYLKTLPVDYLKIDGQFISHVADDPVDRSMVEAICKVGRALGIETVAECVESQAMLDELSRIGIDYAQGYFLARPEPIERLVL